MSEKLSKAQLTSMYSSRMRTARLLTVCLQEEVHLFWEYIHPGQVHPSWAGAYFRASVSILGMQLSWGCILPVGVYTSSGGCILYTPPVNRHTSVKILPCSILRMREVKILIDKLYKSSYGPSTVWS